MACPVCGEICNCSSSSTSAASNVPVGPEDSLAWRQEVAARLNRYQARRKQRPPRYPSLQLPFDRGDLSAGVDNHSIDTTGFSRLGRAVSNQALALDEFAGYAPANPVPEKPEPGQAQFSTEAATISIPTEPSKLADVHATLSTATPSAKIIEFPRSWTPPPAPLDQLAEPVMDRPRILEAPEIVPPPPALGGITIEQAPQPHPGTQPGVDIPLHCSSLSRRIIPAAIDAAIVFTACAVFAGTFWELTAIRPPLLQIAGIATGLFILFWFTYQSLLVIYSGTTPGLRLARLQISRFDGSLPGRRLRRWRVLASFLSAASLGMGYVWVFLDEDALCWHDRITRTYLAPKS